MKDPIILGIANPESQQGKSTITWLLANSLALSGARVAILDCDVVNPEYDDPTVSSYVKPGIPLLFPIYVKETWRDSYIDNLDYLFYDSSRTPPKWVINLIKQTAHGVIIPIRNGRGFKKGIDYARSLYQAGVALHFVINNFVGEQAGLIEGICTAMQAGTTTIPDLDGIHDMCTAGKLPQMLPRDVGNTIQATGDKLASAIVGWVDTFAQDDDDAEENNLRAIG